MKNCVLALTLLAANVIAAAPALAQAPGFDWSGAVAYGKTVEIRGVNGSVRALESDDGAVRVEAMRSARRSDPASVRIEVVEHDGGVTICAVYPTPSGSRSENGCRRGGGGMNTRDNDVQVDFVVRVPSGVRLAATTVNGAIDVQALRSDVQATTVNGSVNIQTTGFVSNATTVNGGIVLEMPADLNANFHATTVNGEIDSDFPMVATGRLSRRNLQATIGSGGPELRATTVNGSISLRRR